MAKRKRKKTAIPATLKGPKAPRRARRRGGTPNSLFVDGKLSVPVLESIQRAGVLGTTGLMGLASEAVQVLLKKAIDEKVEKSKTERGKLGRELVHILERIAALAASDTEPRAKDRILALATRASEIAPDALGWGKWIEPSGHAACCGEREISGSHAPNCRNSRNSRNKEATP